MDFKFNNSQEKVVTIVATFLFIPMHEFKYTENNAWFLLYG